MKNANKILVKKLEERPQIEVTGEQDRIILNWILEKYVCRVPPEILWFRTGNGDRLLCTR
jgi:hypothetical protein